MFKVTFTFENGSEVEVFANAGDNLLEVARGANVALRQNKAFFCEKCDFCQVIRKFPE